jgi:hypothetical protein
MFPGKLIARLGLLGIVAAATYRKLRGGQPDELPDWLECSVPAPASDSKAMPQDGGGIKLRVEPGHTLEIPGGALPRGTRVTLKVLEDTKPGVEIEVGPPVKKLSTPATLTITYDGCESKRDPEKYRIWRKVRNQDRWVRVGGSRGKGTQTISVKLPSFSTYSLAAN